MSLCLLLATVPLPAWSGEIILPSSALDRDARVQAHYKTELPGTGKWPTHHHLDGCLWSPHRAALDSSQASRYHRGAFSLGSSSGRGDAEHSRRPVLLHGRWQRGAQDRRDERAEISFIARPPDRTWWDYQIIMWQTRTAEQYAALKTLGVSAGAAVYRRQRSAAARRSVAERSAMVRREYRHRFLLRLPSAVSGPGEELEIPGSEAPLRQGPFRSEVIPSRSEPERPGVARQDSRPARGDGTAQCALPPLFYNLGDEPGIADLSAFWDFDFSSHSLTGMRAWLAERYGTLAALNRQWGTTFTTWATSCLTPRIKP